MDQGWTVRMGLALALAVGCGGKTPPAPAVDVPTAATAPAPAEATPEAPAATGGFQCALNCSGVEKTATGDTEEAARAAVTAMVGDVCNPDDGQYFVTCLPLGEATP